METIIIIALLVIAAETTYLSVTTARKNARVAQAPVFVDTSVLIDGRIVSIASSGFVSRPLYIPRSVVGELQFLADNADTDKRTRARHGLDIITQLQALTTVKAIIFNDGVRATDGVDNRLLELAKRHGGAVCTIDYNLNKVAVVEGIEVLNVNELARSLRMAYLPGERTLIALTQKGNDSHQGVGHLSDGTMVVVEQAQKYVGKTVEIEFIRSLQTAAGKMMFAKVVSSADTAHKDKNKSTATKITQEAKTSKPNGRKVPKSSSNKSTYQSKARTQSPKNQGRRKSPEDSLVELANK